MGAHISEGLSELLDDIFAEIFFFSFDSDILVFPLISDLNEIVDILAGEIAVSFLHDLEGDLGHTFVAGAYGCFDLLEF